MASGPSTSSPSASAIPTLVPQGQHTGKPAMPMGRPFTLVGSRHRAHLHLLSRSVSKSHAIIVNDHGSLYIRDTASREHVYVNGEAVKEAELRNGDAIRIGTFTFKLADSSKRSGRNAAARPHSAAVKMPGATLPTLIEGRTLLIGRRSTCDIVLSELAVSNMHAVIFELEGRHYIRDLGSRTGTFVNGQPIHHQSLNFDDQIRVGDHEMRFVPGGIESSVDELEHLVGTATLGSEQATLATADAARAAASETTHEQETIPLAGEEDVIPLRREEAAEVAVEEPTPMAAAAAAAEPAGDLAELDLDSDPDVSGSGDTRAIPMESPSDTPRTPVLSSQVVDDPSVSAAAIDSVLGDEVGIESEERHLLVGVDLGEDHLTASGSFANVAHHEEDEEAAANVDFDLTDFSQEAPGDAVTTDVSVRDAGEATVDKHVDTMYFDPEPAGAVAESIVEANPPATLEVPVELHAVPPVDRLTASSHEVPAVETAGVLEAVSDDTNAAIAGDESSEESLPAAASIEPAVEFDPAAEAAASTDQPDTLTATPVVEQVLAAPDPISAEDLADRYLAAPLVPEAMGVEPVASATADWSFAQPAVLHGPESAGFAEGTHETFQHQPVAPADEAYVDESSGEEEPLIPEEHSALMPDDLSAPPPPGNETDPFGGEVPPPFPAGLAQVIGSGAVGVPSWTAVRAETSRVRRPLGEIDSNADAAGGSADSPQEPREVLEQTDPTPESAQHLLEVQIGDTWAETYADLMPGTEELSDTKFGLVVQDFAGSDLGSLVENSGAAPHVSHPQDADPVLDDRQVSASPPGEFALTAHDSLQLEPEPVVELPLVDSTGFSADASRMQNVVDESTADMDAMLAAEGFLPGPTGDDLVDQAMAFLAPESEPTQAALPAEPVAPQEAEHPPIVKQLADESPSQQSESALPAMNAPAEAPASAALAHDGIDGIDEAHATAAAAIDPGISADQDMGLEFEDLTIEEMFSPVAVQSSESARPAASDESAGGPEQGLVFNEAPTAATSEMPDTLSSPQMDLNHPEAQEHESPTVETEFAATAAEDLLPSEAPVDGDVVELPQNTSSHANAPPSLQIEEVELPEAAAPIVPASVAAPAPIAPAAAPQSNMQLLMGMSRDFGSFLGGMPLSLPPMANKPAPPPPLVARPKPAPLFGETPVMSMFRDDSAGTSRPAPQPLPPAVAPAAPLSGDKWTVLPHPDAPQQRVVASPTVPVVPAPAPAAPPPHAPSGRVTDEINKPAPAPADVAPAEEELEELPDLGDIDQAEPEMDAAVSELPELEPEPAELQDIEPAIAETPATEPELAELPELDAAISELPELEPEPAELQDIEPAIAEAPATAPVLAELPEMKPAISELPEPEPEPAELQDTEPAIADAPAAEVELAEVKEIESERPAAPDLLELPEAEPELAELPELEIAEAPEAEADLPELPDLPEEAWASPEISPVAATPVAGTQIEELPEVAELPDEVAAGRTLPQAGPELEIPPAPVQRAAIADEAPAAMFDAAPDVLDELPESMERISDVTEAVGEKPPTPPASTKAPVVPVAAALAAEAAALAPAPSAAPAAPAGRAGAKSPSRPNAGAQSADPAADAPAKPKRVTPPPMARSIRRPTGPAQGQGMVGGGNPMMPSVDIFSQQQQPVMPDAFGMPQIPPSGFIPPTTGAARRSPRPAAANRPATKQSAEAPPAPRKASSPPAQKIPLDAGSVLRMPPAATSQFGQLAPAKNASGPAGKAARPANAPAVAQKPRTPRKPAVVETLYNVEEDFGTEPEGGEAETLPDSRPDESLAQTPSKAPRDSAQAPGRRKSKKWRFPFFGLLALAAVSGAGAAGAWYAMPVNSTIKAGLRFENLDQQPTSFLVNFNAAQRKEMESDAFSKSAQRIYEIAFHGHAGDDFLYRQGDFLPVVNGAKINGDRLVFVKESHDPDGDRLRFQAILKALYTVDQKMRDAAATQRIALENARKEYADLEQGLIDLRRRIDDGQKRQADFDLARKNEKDISNEAASLEKAWSDATSATRKARANLDLLEASQGGANAAIDSDAQLQQMTQRLKGLGESLAAARGAHSGDARAAAAAFDTALSAYKAEIERVKTATGDSSPLAGYVAVAQQVEEAIRQINADLSDRQKTSQQTIADLNRKLADKIEQHLKRTWGADENLRKNSQDLGIYQHQLGAVTGAGLTDEATRIRVLVDTFQKAVDARRNQLAAPSLYPADITAMQQLVADQTEQMRGEQSRADQRMSEQFKLLSSARPEVSTLSDQQQTYLNGLVEKLTAVGTARQHLVAAQMPGGGGDVKSLEAETTELAAQIEARRREIADAGKNATPAPDSPDVVQARAALDASQQADAAAFSDWSASKAKLADAQTALDKLQSNQPDLVRDLAAQKSAQARYDELKTQIDRDSAKIPVTPVDPDHEDGVQVSGLSGNNRLFAMGGIAAFFAVSSLFLIGRSRRQSRPRMSRNDPSNAPDEQDAAPIEHRPLTAA